MKRNKLISEGWISVGKQGPLEFMEKPLAGRGQYNKLVLLGELVIGQYHEEHLRCNVSLAV